MACTLVETDNRLPSIYDYENKIRYQDFSKIDFDSILKHKIRPPRDFEKEVHGGFGPFSSDLLVHDKALLEDLIAKEISKLQVNPEQISALKPKEAVKLALKISISALDYKPVDTDKEFLSQHGYFLPIEEYMALGAGDCDKFRDASIAAFKYLKARNSSLQNIYLSDEYLGGEYDATHAWNSLIIFYEDKIVLSHLDPTQYESGLGLEAMRGKYVSQDDKEIVDKFIETITWGRTVVF